jgi:hypothetical protein
MRRSGQATRWLSIVLGSVLTLISWCAMDYVYVVHPAWDLAHPSSETIEFSALLAAVFSICWYRHRHDFRSAALTFVFSILGGIVLIIFIGMRFHFSIGGRL